jgi:hypothetical protein
MRAVYCRLGVFAVVLTLAAGCETPHETAFSAKVGGGWARLFEKVKIARGPTDSVAIFAAPSNPMDTSIWKIDPFGEVDPFGEIAHPSLRMFSLTQDAQALRVWVTAADSEAHNSLRSTRIDAVGKTSLAQGVERVEIEPTRDGQVVWTWTSHGDITVL